MRLREFHFATFTGFACKFGFTNMLLSNTCVYGRDSVTTHPFSFNVPSAAVTDILVIDTTICHYLSSITASITLCRLRVWNGALNAAQILLELVGFTFEILSTDKIVTFPCTLNLFLVVLNHIVGNHDFKKSISNAFLNDKIIITNMTHILVRTFHLLPPVGSGRWTEELSNERHEHPRQKLCLVNKTPKSSNLINKGDAGFFYMTVRDRIWNRFCERPWLWVKDNDGDS